MDLMSILSSASESSAKATKRSYKINVAGQWLCSITIDVDNKRNNPLHAALAEKQQSLTGDEMLQILTALICKSEIEVSQPKVSEKLDLSSLL